MLAELVALCNARRINPKAALDFAEEVERSGDIEIVWIGPTEHRAGIELLTKRPDKAYSLCDAVSFVLMRRRGLTDALTTDRHFEAGRLCPIASSIGVSEPHQYRETQPGEATPIAMPFGEPCDSA